MTNTATTDLATEMAQVIADLNTATGLDWYVEMTGGGCYWLTATTGTHYFGVTGIEGPLVASSTVEAIEADGGWWICSYQSIDGDIYDESDADTASLCDTAARLVADVA